MTIAFDIAEVVIYELGASGIVIRTPKRVFILITS